MIGHDNVLRIADFGLARVWSDNSSGEMTGGLGTPTFMAPEMLRSGIPCSEKVDIYSFAVVCWSLMLTRYFHASDIGPQIMSTIALQEFCQFLLHPVKMIDLPTTTTSISCRLPFEDTNMTHFEVMEFIIRGNRLALSNEIPLSNVIEKAWCQDPNLRPSFEEIGEMLQSCQV